MTLQTSRRTALASFAGLLAWTSNGRAQTAKPPTIVAEHMLEKRDGVKFSRPTEITNPWLPLKPGMRYVYDGTTMAAGGNLVPHRLVLNVTDLVKVVDGVPNVVCYDLDYSNGELEEAELAFFAQDDDGNVWHFGQYPEEYENGRLLASPAWLPGIADARAGIMMKADPKLGAPSYSQGYGPMVNWTDRGETHLVGQEVVIGDTKYSNVLVIKETSIGEEGAWQTKYYAQGIGNIKVGYLGETDKSKETLVLTSAQMMSEDEMEATRNRALALERSGYRRSPDVYGKTAPSTIRPPAK